MSKEKKARKKTGNAPLVEAKPPEKEVVDPLSQPIVLPENIKELAVGTGIPIDQIVDRANLIQQRILGLEQGIMMIAKGLDARDEKLAPLVTLAKQIEERQKAIAQAQTQPQGPMQGQGQGFGQFLPFIQMLGSTSEPDPMTKMFMEAVIKSGLENMFMGSALMKAYVMKVAPQEFAEAMKTTQESMTKAIGEKK